MCPNYCIKILDTPIGSGTPRARDLVEFLRCTIDSRLYSEVYSPYGEYTIYGCTVKMKDRILAGAVRCNSEVDLQ